MTARADLSVVASVRRDLAELAKADRVLAESGLAAAALALAGLLDDPGNSATSKAAAAGQLRETLDRLRELAPPAAAADWLDELERQRERRRAG